MSTNLTRTIPSLVRRATLQIVFIFLGVGLLLSFLYGFVQHYQQKRAHIEQLADMLATNASTPEGASLVARQVDALLASDPSLQSILFYSTEQPLSHLSQRDIERTRNDWRYALLAPSVSVNRAVTSRYLMYSRQRSSGSDQSSSDNNSPASSPTYDAATSQPAGRNVLVGYINITLDIHQLRIDWIRRTLPLWLVTMLIGMGLIWLVFRKFKWPTQDVTELARVCKMVNEDPTIKQLPVIQQRNFLELVQIKQAFISLFERMRAIQQDYEALADFEQQLHNKNLLLDVQRDSFQSMITHELKTSLNAISGGLQLLDHQYLNDEQKDTLAIIQKGSRHLELTLEQIIQLNKIEKGQIAISVSEFNPLAMLSDLLSEFDAAAKQKGLVLTSRVHHIDYTLEGDAGKIKQILRSLIDNAIKFTPQGQVTIESQLMHFNENIRWRVLVIDTGIGISDSYMDDIFTPFFQVDSSKTRRFEGAGMGLPVIKQMVQLIGASIEVSSELGVGSTFSVTMPLRNKFQSQQQTLLSGLHILYHHIDDPERLSTELQHLGAKVSTQRHAQLIPAHLASSQVDIVMIAEEVTPDKAEQLARSIRAAESAHRVLIVYWYPAHQANVVDSFEHGLKAAGVDHCHQITYDSKQLAQLLRSWQV